MLHHNTNMPVSLEAMIALFYKRKIEWRLGTLCKAVSVVDMRLLPWCHNNCFRRMLGACEAKTAIAGRCMHLPDNTHPTVAETPDNYVLQLVEIL